jgi:5'-nucleotidase
MSAAYLALGLAVLLGLALPASAMRILLTNDDGFESRNLQALFSALREAGHDVLISAPYREQSGMSAALGVLNNFPVTTTRSPAGTIPAGSPGVGPTTLAADQFYVDGTPVAAVIHGIETLSRARWGLYPELVISGPNIGSNLGTVTPHSGTVGAAITAINWGVPAIAVSGVNGDAASAPLLAAITLRVLAAASHQGRIALPPGTGLNVNTPALDPSRTAASYRYVFTQISTVGNPADPDPLSERNALAAGDTVTVSPIQGTFQAPPDKAAQVLTKMRDLFSTAIPLHDSKLANLSARGMVGAGTAAKVVGIVISGTSPKNLLIRASGPALASFGVNDLLADPLLEVYDRDNQLVATNDNWGDDAAKATAIAQAATRKGAFPWPAGSRDAALIVTLPAGSFTAVVRGAGDSSGIALVEAYDLAVD